MEDLTKSLVAAAQHPDAKAVVLTSSKFGIFSAGLDINEMIVTGKPDVEAEDRLFAFWTTLQDMWLQLYDHLHDFPPNFFTLIQTGTLILCPLSQQSTAMPQLVDAFCQCRVIIAL
jgi:hypothetical protein